MENIINQYSILVPIYKMFFNVSVFEFKIISYEDGALTIQIQYFTCLQIQWMELFYFRDVEHYIVISVE